VQRIADHVVQQPHEVVHTTLLAPACGVYGVAELGILCHVGGTYHGQADVGRSGGRWPVGSAAAVAFGGEQGLLQQLDGSETGVL